MKMQMKNTYILISCILTLAILLSGCSRKSVSNATIPISQTEFDHFSISYRIKQNMTHVNTTSSGLGGGTSSSNDT